MSSSSTRRHRAGDRTEIERGGQIYFVNNRVESIYSLGDLITRIVPEARVVVGHGQMEERRSSA